MFGLLLPRSFYDLYRALGQNWCLAPDLAVSCVMRDQQMLAASAANEWVRPVMGEAPHFPGSAPKAHGKGPCPPRRLRESHSDVC